MYVYLNDESWASLIHNDVILYNKEYKANFTILPSHTLHKLK